MESEIFEIGKWYEILYVLGGQKLSIYAFLFKKNETSLIFDLSEGKLYNRTKAPPNPYSVRLNCVVDFWEEGTPSKNLPDGWE